MRSRVSEKGQVTIPKRLRERLGIRTGTTLDFEDRDGELVARKVTDTDPIDAVYGLWGGRGPRTDELVDELRGRADAD